MMRVEESRSLDRAGQFVVVDQFGIAEDPRRLAEQPLNGLDVHVDLLDEFGPGIEKTETVIIGLGQKLDAAGLGQGIEGAHHLGAVFLKLFEKNPRQAEGHAKTALVAADEYPAGAGWSADSTYWRLCGRWRRS